MSRRCLEHGWMMPKTRLNDVRHMSERCAIHVWMMLNSYMIDAQHNYEWYPILLFEDGSRMHRAWIQDGSRMNGRWIEDGSRMDPRRVIIFQSACLIAIKTDFRPHLASNLASIGTQKHWSLMGGVSKNMLFTFLILNIVFTRLLINFSKDVFKTIFWSLKWGPRCLQHIIWRLQYILIFLDIVVNAQIMPGWSPKHVQTMPKS